MNYTQFKQSMKTYKPSYVKSQASKNIEPFIYAQEEYSMIKDDANMVSILIFDDYLYMASFKENDKLKYSLVLGNSDYYSEDLEKLTRILYDYAKDYLGFAVNKTITELQKHFDKVENVSYSNDDSDSILVDGYLKIFLPTNDDDTYQLICEVGDENSSFYQYDVLCTSKDINHIIEYIKMCKLKDIEKSVDNAVNKLMKNNIDNNNK